MIDLETIHREEAERKQRALAKHLPLLVVKRGSRGSLVAVRDELDRRFPISLRDTFYATFAELDAAGNELEAYRRP